MINIHNKTDKRKSYYPKKTKRGKNMYREEWVDGKNPRTHAVRPKCRARGPRLSSNQNVMCKTKQCWNWKDAVCLEGNFTHGSHRNPGTTVVREILKPKEKGGRREPSLLLPYVVTTKGYKMESKLKMVACDENVTDSPRARPSNRK